MTRKTKFSLGLLAVAALFAGFALGLTPAHAQNACAASDLACRVAALESRLAALEGRQETVAAQTEALQRAQPNLIGVSRRCATNCAAEAQDICTSRGFASGAPEEWGRERSAGVTLTRVSCSR
jgi:hypothetical protein